MGFHGSGWWAYMRDGAEEKPKVTWDLMKRVLAYARPYQSQIIAMLLLILVSTGLTVITPLITRDLIDRTIPDKNINRLVVLALGLLGLHPEKST